MMGGRRMLALAVFCAAAAATPAAAQDDTPSQTGATGQAVYEKWCRPCHAQGGGHPGTARLILSRGEAFSNILQRPDLNADYIKTVVRDGYQMMPPFRVTEITDAELEAVASYILRQAGQ